MNIHFVKFKTKKMKTNKVKSVKKNNQIKNY